MDRFSSSFLLSQVSVSAKQSSSFSRIKSESNDDLFFTDLEFTRLHFNDGSFVIFLTGAKLRFLSEAKYVFLIPAKLLQDFLMEFVESKRGISILLQGLVVQGEKSLLSVLNLVILTGILFTPLLILFPLNGAHNPQSLNLVKVSQSILGFLGSNLLTCSSMLKE